MAGGAREVDPKHIAGLLSRQVDQANGHRQAAGAGPIGRAQSPVGGRSDLAHELIERNRSLERRKPDLMHPRRRIAELGDHDIEHGRAGRGRLVVFPRFDGGFVERQDEWARSRRSVGGVLRR